MTTRLEADTLVARIAALGDDERAILELLLRRLELGRCHYGEWNLERDKRILAVEALEEVLDCQVYSAARLVQLERLGVQ